VKPGRDDGEGEARAIRSAEGKLDEASALAESIGLEVVLRATYPLRGRRPSTLMGSGQVDLVKAAVQEHEVAVAVVDAKLSPVQQRNLEKAWGCKVIDRTGLILDIFGARARTREGSLQVELAHLDYQRSRLVRSWTHLERQRGGFGFLGGPGETQIETDRRLIGERIGKIKRELEEVRRTRGLQRAARRKVPFPIVALVGYTNAGKSTLFNALTGAGVYAQDQLFATLDPTMRAIKLPSGRTVILSDTVGFVSDLPHELVAAFRATLEEVAEAQVILHVRDIAHEDSAAQRADVIGVLDGIAKESAEEGWASGLDLDWPQRTLEVLNKVDLLGEPDREGLRGRNEAGLVLVSAVTGEGIDGLRAAVDGRLGTDLMRREMALDASDGEALAWLYRHGEVLEREDREDRVHLAVRLHPEDEARFAKRFPEAEH